MSRRLLAALALLPLVASCRHETTPFGLKRDLEHPPVLAVPMLDLSALTAFIAFGGDLGGGKVNPAWEFRASPDTLDVFACAPGVVVRVEPNPSPQTDWEIAVKPHEGSAYTLFYDHVRDVAVAVGDRVEAGTRLGRIGDWGGGEGRTEIQINVEGDPTFAVCPRNLGSASFNADHDAAFAAVGTGGSEPCVRERVEP